MPPRVLPHVVLVDVLAPASGQAADGRHFRYRLAGQVVEQRIGFSLRGRSPHDLLLGAAAEAAVLADYEETARVAVPTYCEHDVVTPQPRRLH